MQRSPHARALGRRRPGRAGCAAAVHHQAGARSPTARRSPPRSPANQACASKPHKQGAQHSTSHSTHRRRARSTRRRARASNTHTRTARARRTPAQRCTQSTLAHSSSSSLPQSNPHTRARTLPTAGARIGRRREEPKDTGADSPRHRAVSLQAPPGIKLAPSRHQAGSLQASRCSLQAFG